MQKSKTLSLTHPDISEDSAKDIKKVAKGAGISFVGSATGRCLSILCQIIIARFFGTEVFGLYTLGFVVLRITELVARLGLDTGAMRFVSISQKDNAGKVKGTLISASFISFLNGIVIGGIVYYFASFISEAIFHKPELTDIIKTFAICVPFMATMMVVATASQGFHTTKYAVYVRDIIQPAANLAIVIVFMQLGFDFKWVVIAFVVSHAIAMFMSFYFITKQFPEIKKKTIKPVYETRKLLSYSGPLLFVGFLQVILSWANIIMLGYMKTPTDVGIYRAASQIPIFLSLILSASSSIYAPAIAEMHHQGQTYRLNNIFQSTTRWVFLATLPIVLVLVFSASEVMTIFGSNYVEAGARVLIILTIAQFINCATGSVGFNLAMTGRQHVEMINCLVMVAINIALNCFLIPTHGCLGAAIATGVSIVVINLVRLVEVYFLCRIQPYNMSYIQWVVCGAIAGTVLYLLDRYLLIDEYLLINNYLLNHANLVRFAANSLVIGIIFVTGFFIKGITVEDRFIFDAMMKKFKFRDYISKA